MGAQGENPQRFRSDSCQTPVKPTATLPTDQREAAATVLRRNDTRNE